MDNDIKDFKFIEEYNSIIENENANMVWDYDQTVPQFQNFNTADDMDYRMDNIARSDETLDSILQAYRESHSSCTYVPDAVPDVTEQLPNLENSDIKQFHDLDTPFYNNQPSQQVTPSFAQLEAVRDTEPENIQDFEKILVSVVKTDIRKEAMSLNISEDPTFWGIDDVHKWIDWICRKYDLIKPNMDFFRMNGISLCMLSESDFVYKSPESGSTLFNQLDIWKNACRLTDFPNNQSNIPTPVLNNTVSYHPVPCVSPSPSLESSCSSDDSNSPRSHHNISTPPPHRGSAPRQRQNIPLWQFIKELLKQADKFGDCVKWLDRSRGVFKVEDSSRLAKEWGLRKNRPKMNYDKLSRSIRQYYRKGIIKKTEQSKRLVYQFCTPYL